jgi:hypothetical protein
MQRFPRFWCSLPMSDVPLQALYRPVLYMATYKNDTMGDADRQHSLSRKHWEAMQSLANPKTQELSERP